MVQLVGIQKQIERDKPEEQKQDEAWQQIKKSILSTAATIINIDNGTERGYSRPLFVNSITGLITRLAANGQTDHVKKSIDLIREVNAKHSKPIITEKNKIFSLIDQAEAAAETKRDQANRENASFKFEGGEVIINYELERVQITNEHKPSAAELQALKQKGLSSFNWSPSNNAWQRKLTRNAIYSVQAITGVIIPPNFY